LGILSVPAAKPRWLIKLRLVWAELL